MTETDLRQDVATCLKLFEAVGLIDFSGHVSARIPGSDTMLINSRDQSRTGIEPHNLLQVDFNGQVTGGNGYAPMETPIHTAVYRTRPDVMAVAHIHPANTIALSAAGKEYVPVIFHGAIFGKRVPVYDDCRHVDTIERGVAMTDALGTGRAVIIRGHGATVVGGSVRGVFCAAMYLEDNARILTQAYSMGTIRPLSDEELAEGPRISTEIQFNKVWNYYLAKANGLA